MGNQKYQSLIRPLWRNCRTLAMPVYAVKQGRQTGVFDTCAKPMIFVDLFSALAACDRIFLAGPECLRQVQGWSGAAFKKFSTKAEAVAWLHEPSPIAGGSCQIEAAHGSSAATPFHHKSHAFAVKHGRQTGVFNTCMISPVCFNLYCRK